MKCARCKTAEIRVRPNALYCDPCRKAMRTLTEIRANERKKESQKSARLEIKQSPKTKKSQIMTKAEQMAIDKAVDDKHAFNLGSRIIRPGDPDFDEIAATVRPLKSIRRGHPLEITYIDAESTPMPRLRRLESVNEL